MGTLQYASTALLVSAAVHAGLGHAVTLRRGSASSGNAPTPTDLKLDHSKKGRAPERSGLPRCNHSARACSLETSARGCADPGASAWQAGCSISIAAAATAFPA